LEGVGGEGSKIEGVGGEGWGNGRSWGVKGRGKMGGVKKKPTPEAGMGSMLVVRQRLGRAGP